MPKVFWILTKHIISSNEEKTDRLLTKMTSWNIFRVSILCVIFCSMVNVVLSKDDEAMIDGDLTQIFGLDIFKNVDLWKNGQKTSLGETFGPNPAEWSVDSGNLPVITDMSLTALCCLYCSQIMNFVHGMEYDFAECENIRNGLPAKKTDTSWMALYELIKCFDGIKQKFKPWRAIALEMLTTALNFTKAFDVRADKNALNAIMSFYLFASGVEKEKSQYDVTSCRPKEIELNFHKKFVAMKLYTRNLIESFAVLHCAWKKFDDGDRSNNKMDDRRDAEIVTKFNLPETHFKREHFNSDRLFLTNVSEIRFDPDNAFSRVGSLSVDNGHSYIPVLEHYSRHVREEDYRSENVTKSQTIAFQSVAMTVYYLIREIINTSEKTGKALGVHTENIVTKAIDILRDFNFPGLLRVKLRNVMYQRAISTNNGKALSTIFAGSQINSSEVNELVAYSPECKTSKTVESLTTLLERFTSDIKAVESDIKAVKEINENLCDYEYEEVGFFQYDTSEFKYQRFGEDKDKFEQAKLILKPLKENNCQFSIVVVVHFILNDYIMSQCESIALDTNHLYTFEQLESCFNYMIKSIGLIGEKLDHSLNTIIKTLNSTGPYNNGNRKIIDSILAMKLYFSNGNLLNSKVPLIEQGSVDTNRVVSKLDTLKRCHRFVMNLIENYTIHRCSTPSTREEFTNITIDLLTKDCSNFMVDKDKTRLIECVNGLIEENLKKFKTVETQMDRNDYTVESLLMNNIFSKASTTNSSLSMLLDIEASWDGHFKRLPEIVDLVKNNINPKYLCKYQLTMINAIVFIAYDKMKTIIRTSTANNNFLLYSNRMDALLDALGFFLGVLFSPYIPTRIITVYRTIFAYFKEYFSDGISIEKDTLVRIIEVEQYYLGLQKGPSNAKVDGIVLSIPDHTLAATSEPPDVEKLEQYVFEMDINTDDGQTNINQLLAYSSDVKAIWTSLSNVLRLLNLKKMTDVVVQ